MGLLENVHGAIPKRAEENGELETVEHSSWCKNLTQAHCT